MDDEVDTPCPYCAERARNSRDHIFPEFLGGTKTIGACKECNDTFGHSAEGPVSTDLAPFAVTLRKSGIKAPCYTVWRKAVVHEGIEWDLDTELVMRPAKPTFEQDGDVARAIFPAARGAKKYAAQMKKQGKNIQVKRSIFPPIHMNQTNFSFTIGIELRRVAMKMCVAVANHFGMADGVLDALSRDYLLNRVENSERTRIDWRIHPALEGLRSPLSHLIFVKGNSSTRRCYGVTQFYGAVQLQLILNEKEYVGGDFACFGRLDPVASYQETFGVADLLLIPEAPARLNSFTWNVLTQEWLVKLTNECKAAFGQEDAHVSIHS